MTEDSEWLWGVWIRHWGAAGDIYPNGGHERRNGTWESPAPPITKLSQGSDGTGRTFGMALSSVQILPLASCLLHHGALSESYVFLGLLICKMPQLGGFVGLRPGALWEVRPWGLHCEQEFPSLGQVSGKSHPREDL